MALHVTLALLEQRPDHRYYLPIIDLLSRLHMIDMREIDTFVAKDIERMDNQAILFGTHAVKVRLFVCLLVYLLVYSTSCSPNKETISTTRGT